MRFSQNYTQKKYIMKEKRVTYKPTGDVIASHLRASLHVK